MSIIIDQLILIGDRNEINIKVENVDSCWWKAKIQKGILFKVSVNHGKSKHGAGNGESSCGVRVTPYDQSNSKIH